MFKIFRTLLACVITAGMLAVTPAPALARTADVPPLQAARYVRSETPRGPLEIVISLPAQRLYVYRGGERVAESRVSTGEAGRETPTGVFSVLGKERFHRSSLYHDAPMPYMQRLTWDGVAMHGGPLPGYAASHGCIRLPYAFARKLFAMTSVGTKVVVTDSRPDSARAARKRPRPAYEPSYDGEADDGSWQDAPDVQ